MKRLISTQSLAAAAIAMGAFGAASAAHARSDVYFSIGVQSPGGYVQPAPVYVQPQPVYVHPRAYVAPEPIYVRPVPRPYDQQWGYQGQHRDHYGHGRHARRFGPYGDYDRDGIANQYDRDIDGDGVRNRRDHAPYDPRFR